MKYPPISVAMPYWNRPDELARSLASYAKVYPDLDIEFSICDDGSSRPGKWPRNCKLTTLKPKTEALNPCVPINRAVRAATREIIVLTNPEIEHRERVLDKMLEALTGPNDYVMTGARNAPYQYRRGLQLVDSPTGEWIAGSDAPRAPVGGRKPMPPGVDLHFCVMFYRSLFERAGGFDEAYRGGVACDDNDWAWKLWALGDVNFKRVPGCVWHYVTRHGWKGKPGVNYELLDRKWGHLPEYAACVS